MTLNLPQLSPLVREAFELHGDAPLPLVRSRDCPSRFRKMAAADPAQYFPKARDALAAQSGLLLLLGCWEESHQLSQECASPEGSFWHAIAHRLEPDAANAGYWFRQVGEHPTFASLRKDAARILSQSVIESWVLKPNWDPFLFIQWCEKARSLSGSEDERVAVAIQEVECRSLFQWCALPDGA